MKLTEELKREIEHLKKENDLIILAHTYQIAEVQELADYVGDSLGLALRIRDIKQKNIVFCGVRFMAETAKVLAPDKNIILPVEDAMCPMASMITAKQLNNFKKRNPEYKVVSYVNSTLETKAESYITCTSSNALDIVRHLDADKVLFVPDKNLGTYVKDTLGKADMEVWSGFCSVHNKIKQSELEQLKMLYPNALVLVHPETNKAVQKLADFIGSTGAIINYAKTHTEFNEFIIITEKGVKYQLEHLRPDAKFYFLETMLCVNMKKITLESLYLAVKELKHSVEIDSDLATRARIAIERMLNT